LSFPNELQINKQSKLSKINQTLISFYYTKFFPFIFADIKISFLFIYLKANNKYNVNFTVKIEKFLKNKNKALDWRNF